MERKKRPRRSRKRKPDEGRVSRHALARTAHAAVVDSRLVAAAQGQDQLPEAQTERAIETIERNAKAQAQLIEDVLDVSRIISGKMRLEVVPLDLAKVIDAAVDAVRPAAEAKGISLERVIDSDAMIAGDADRLQQIIWNLLSNAIKFTPRGGRVQID